MKPQCRNRNITQMLNVSRNVNYPIETLKHEHLQNVKLAEIGGKNTVLTEISSQ